MWQHESEVHHGTQQVILVRMSVAAGRSTSVRAIANCVVSMKNKEIFKEIRLMQLKIKALRSLSDFLFARMHVRMHL